MKSFILVTLIFLLGCTRTDKSIIGKTNPPVKDSVNTPVASSILPAGERMDTIKVRALMDQGTSEPLTVKNALVITKSYVFAPKDSLPVKPFQAWVELEGNTAKFATDKLIWAIKRQ